MSEETEREEFQENPNEIGLRIKKGDQLEREKKGMKEVGSAHAAKIMSFCFDRYLSHLL